MTHKDVIRFGERYGISPPPKSTPVTQRRYIERQVANMMPDSRAMSQLAIDQLLKSGGGPAVEHVSQKLEDVSAIKGPIETQGPENVELHEAIFEARALIKDLWEAGVMDKQTIWSLADVLSIEHTMLQNLGRDQRVRLAQSTVARLVDDSDSARQALSGHETIKYSEYKRIIDHLNGADVELPTLLERSRDPEVYDKKVRELSSGQQPEQYRRDLNCMVGTLRVTYLAGNDGQ